MRDSPHGAEVYIANRDGHLVPIKDLLSINIPVGPKGDKGDSIVGPAGPVGKDSTVPGPKGDSIVGPQGPPGDLTIVGDEELQAAVAKLRAQKAAALATIAENMKAMGNHPVYTLARLHLEEAKRKLEN